MRAIVYHGVPANEGSETDENRSEEKSRTTVGDRLRARYPFLKPRKKPAANPPEIESVERIVMTQSGGAPVAAS